MKKLANKPETNRNDEEGLSTVEYVVILVLIVVLGITVWRSFGSAVTSRVEQGTKSINDLGT